MTDPWKFEPSDPGCGLEQFIGEAIGAASVCWEFPEKAGIFDSTKAKAICDAVYERAMSPEGARLGMATTRDLLNELHARFALDLSDKTTFADNVAKMRIMLEQHSPKTLEYRTVDE